MRFSTRFSVLLPFFLLAIIGDCFAANEHHFLQDNDSTFPGRAHNVSLRLFAELEELARLVDIAYCVGVTGIYPPFECASRCSQFSGYQLVDTWNTGPLMADSCGYIVLDHNGPGRIIVAFRGTYSVANTIVDLSTIPQEYVPYPSDPEDGEDNGKDSKRSYLDLLPRSLRWLRHKSSPSSTQSSIADAIKNIDTNEEVNNPPPKGPKCKNCTVHTGFLTSWKTTRPFILPHLQTLHTTYPTYTLHLVGHSLGGAVAALASLECEARGWKPVITTFGEPRIGNVGLRNYVDEMFDLAPKEKETETSSPSALPGKESRYRRVTHTSDPVPLLPLTEWSFAMHAGEIYISKAELQPGLTDLRRCEGDEDVRCIYGEETGEPLPDPDPKPNPTPEAKTNSKPRSESLTRPEVGVGVGIDADAIGDDVSAKWGIPLPARYKMWQLFFAHRDYFWRLGLCVPGGDPADWGRGYDFGGGGGGEKEEGKKEGPEEL